MNPSAIVPGPQDNVIVPGPIGNGVETLSGGGTVASALFTGNAILSGGYALGALGIGQGGQSGLLELDPGAVVQCAAATLTAGSLLANGAGTRFTCGGTLALGSAALGNSANLDATGGGIIQLLGLALGDTAAAIYVDPASILEIGTLGAAVAGALTIDPGFTLSGVGDANAYAQIVNNGTIAALAGGGGGTLLLGTITGSGVLAIGAGATLELQGPAGAGEAVSFAGQAGTLTLRAEYDAPAGTVSGFATGDAIDIAGSAISSATFSQSSQAGGTLTLWYGNQVADRLILAGNYAGSTFLTAGDGARGTLITLAPGSSNGGTPSPGTSTPDIYLWVAPGAGKWNAVANWEDQSRGQNPAGIAPGINDSDTIAVSQTSFTVIGGPANAASLLVTGELGLNGSYAIGTLGIGQAGGTGFTNGTLDFLAGTTIATTATAIAAGAIAVSGSGSTLSVSGTLTLGGGPLGVGLPVTALSATAGGMVQAAALVMGGGSGDSITTDPTGIVEIGTAGGAAAGAVTVDAGALLTGNGSVNPFGSIVDNGHISESGGLLELGLVTGGGNLRVSNGVLQLNYATKLAIAFSGGNGVLAVSGEQALPQGVLVNFQPGDLIDVLGDPVTSASFTESASGTAGVLTLAYDGTPVGTVALFGTYTQDQFLCASDGSTGTYIEVTQQSSGGGGGGQTGTDALSWTGGAGDGNWSNAANWFDTAINATASLPPGSQTPATLAGPTGTHPQSIGGTGSCASLALSGDLAFSGAIAIGSLTLGTDPGTGTALSGTVLLTAGGTFAAASGFFADGSFAVDGAGAALDVAGTLVLGDGPETPALMIEAGAACSLGALSMGGGTLSVDGQSALVIGAAGAGAAGTLSVASGGQASGYGALDPFGTISDAGTITALGGTLELGAVLGSGTLAIGTESTLALAASASAGISFAGGGATLLLEAPALPASVIAGFAPGDSIVIATTAPTAVTYTPGAGGPGTLTLSSNGTVVGTLSLAGDYAGDIFSLAPDGSGAALTVSVPGNVPPPGTATPDAYVWTGAGGSGAWANSGNWQDVSAGQDPAALAPGQNDLVSIAAGGFPLAITGPADAAQLGFTGTVSLSGSYAIGQLAAGSAQQTGELVLAAGDSIAVVTASILGGLAGQGGTLAASGALSLGADGASAGVVIADGATAIQAQSVTLGGPGSLLETDQTGSIAVGMLAAAQAGAVTIGADGLIAGNGAVNPGGLIADDGVIEALGGTLALGTVSGAGTLLIGPGATLEAGMAAPTLAAAFAGAGTLALGSASTLPALMDFGPSDAVVLPVSGATGATYAQDAPGSGLLTVYAGAAPLLTLVIEGNASDLLFAVATAPGGGTVLTAYSANTAGIEGEPMTTPYPLAPGGNTLTAPSLYAFGQDDMPFAAAALSALDGGLSCYVWELDGSEQVGPPLYGPGFVPGINLEVVADQPVETGNPSSYTLQAGYQGIVALGAEPVDLFDNVVGDALLVGNGNNNPLQPNVLFAGVSGDTLVGAPGSNTQFYAQGGGYAFIQGGGNDTIRTTTDDAAITTAGGAASHVFIGASDNYVRSDGADSIIAAITSSQPAQDTVYVGSAAGAAGPTVFGPLDGQISVNGGANHAWLIGNGGQLVMTGGGGNGNYLFANSSNASFFGGAGSAVVVGSTTANDPLLQVHGGSGALTVFGGTGDTFIAGGAGPAIFVAGQGPTTIQASANDVSWLVDSAPVTVFGAAGMQVYAGPSSGNDVFLTNGGSETLFGGAGNDDVYLTSGAGTFVAGTGHDLIQFTNGISSGTDEIVNFKPGLDVIALAGYGGAQPSLSYGYGDTFITMPDGGPKVIAWGVHLTSANFVSY